MRESSNTTRTMGCFITPGLPEIVSAIIDTILHSFKSMDSHFLNHCKMLINRSNHMVTSLKFEYFEGQVPSLALMSRVISYPKYWLMKDAFSRAVSKLETIVSLRRTSKWLDTINQHDLTKLYTVGCKEVLVSSKEAPCLIVLCWLVSTS
ncbi:hypothetical protein BDA99DRAFT_531612 [Phascolomyces articulosus]|uniref:Uncharacterized protein n=1 Tax=Phascolomyces articulosus TaxID=60185 RepID=A0AAD5KCZ2_9FUNG|nr:hypothetical protein BDA99DRAFT_531612 [Phascolomyces articulosus]